MAQFFFIPYCKLLSKQLVVVIVEEMTDFVEEF